MAFSFMEEDIRQGFVRLTAMGIFQSLQITSLQKAISGLAAKSKGMESGIETMFWVWKDTQKHLNEKLAALADEDPAVASELKRYLQQYDETKLG